jgi:hypothetical protein
MTGFTQGLAEVKAKSRSWVVQLARRIPPCQRLNRPEELVMTGHKHTAV